MKLTEEQVFHYYQTRLDAYRLRHSKGMEYRSRCPFHDGGNPSILLTHLDQGYFVCFGCEAKGKDVLAFEQLMQRKETGSVPQYDLVVRSIEQVLGEPLQKRVYPEVVTHLQPSARQKSATLVRGGGLRAAESFAATIPGFAAIADVAFPVVGAIALTAEVAKGVREFIQMRKEAQEAAEKIQDGFRSINGPIEQSVDTLRKHNAELAISIARLEHKPANTLALAAADASLEMDRLGDRAHRAYLETKKLFEESKRGFIATLYGGATGDQGLDADLAKGTISRQRKIDQLRDANAEASRLPSDNAQSKAAREAEIAAQRNELSSYLASQKTLRSGQIDETDGFLRTKTGRKTSYAAEYGKQDQNLDFISGVQRGLRNEDSEDDERKIDAAQEARQKQLESQKLIAAAGAAAARKALEEQRKVAEAQREQWATEFSEWSAAANRSAAEIAFYWARKEAEAAAGSKNYMEAVRNSNAAIREMNRETQRMDKENGKILFAMQLDSLKRVNRADSEGSDAVGGRGLAFITALQSQVKAQQQGNDALKEAQIQRGVETGQLSKTAAAYQLVTIHAQEYARATDALDQKRQGVGDNDPDRAQKLKLLDVEQTKLDASNAVTVFQDSARLAATSWQNAFKNANAQFIQDSRDSAKQVSGLYGSLLNGVNADLGKAFSQIGERGHRHIGRELGTAVGGTLRGVGGELAGIGLRRVESTVLSGFGIGAKADGSRSNPYSVFVTNSIDGKDPGVAGATSAVWSLASGSDIGGSVAGFAKSALSFLPGGSFLSGIFGGARAIGGGVDVGKSYLVGENGPEVWSPGATGFITPNNRISSGGSNFTIGSIDARGSNDPAAVRAQVMAGIREAAPHIIAASGQQQRDQRLRSPRNSG